MELTVRELTLHDSMKPHHLVVENEEGKFSYDFKLAIEQPTLSTLPTPKGDTHCDPSNFIIESKKLYLLICLR